MLLYIRLMILASVDKAVSMHMTIQQSQMIVSVGCQAKLMSIAIFTKKGFAKRYDSIAR